MSLDAPETVALIHEAVAEVRAAREEHGSHDAPVAVGLDPVVVDSMVSHMTDPSASHEARAADSFVLFMVGVFVGRKLGAP